MGKDICRKNYAVFKPCGSGRPVKLNLVKQNRVRNSKCEQQARLNEEGAEARCTSGAERKQKVGKCFAGHPASEGGIPIPYSVYLFSSSFYAFIYPTKLSGFTFCHILHFGARVVFCGFPLGVLPVISVLPGYPHAFGISHMVRVCHVLPELLLTLGILSTLCLDICSVWLAALLPRFLGTTWLAVCSQLLKYAGCYSPNLPLYCGYTGCTGGHDGEEARNVWQVFLASIGQPYSSCCHEQASETRLREQ